MLHANWASTLSRVLAIAAQSGLLPEDETEADEASEPASEPSLLEASLAAELIQTVAGSAARGTVAAATTARGDATTAAFAATTARGPPGAATPTPICRI